MKKFTQKCSRFGEKCYLCRVKYENYGKTDNYKDNRAE